MNQIDLKGRVAVVTGGAQGIGYAITERLLASGARAVLWDIDRAKLDEALAVLGKLGPVSGEVVELTDDAAVAAATKKAGAIDILVNNAGITGGNATTWELDPAVWRRVIEVNLIAPYLTCRHVAPVLMARGWGRIVNIASVAGKEGNPNASHYSASKAGLIALTKSLAKELATKNVLVNAVKGVKDVQQRSMEDGRAELDVSLSSTAEAFATELATRKFQGYACKVRKVTPNAVEVELK